jgi:5-bromo-4-chloroindolyl phosphate hydrolysis protein
MNQYIKFGLVAAVSAFAAMGATRAKDLDFIHTTVNRSIAIEKDKLLESGLTCQDLAIMRTNIHELDVSTTFLVNIDQLGKFMVDSDSLDTISRLESVVDEKIDIAGCLAK